MSSLAPRWAFNAQAIDAAGDPSLLSGVHFRILPSHTVGLPAAPFEISRVNLGAGARLAPLRHDITWVAADGTNLTAPFDVTPGNDVTGYVPAPANGICCWIEVDAQPAIELGGGGTLVPTPLPTATLGPEPAPRPGPFPVHPHVGHLSVQALVGTARGPAPVARRDLTPYQLGASRIEQVIVSGHGTVKGVSWVDARTLKPGTPWRRLGLPVSSGTRYVGVPNAAAEAITRAQRGAPPRQGLHDAPSAASAGGTPAASPADEVARLTPLEPDVLAWINQLLNDTSASPWDLRRTSAITDAGGSVIGTARVETLPLVLHAALDPGMGRWIGFVDRDEAPLSTTAGDVVAYVVRGVWQFDQKHLGGLASSLPAQSIEQDVPDVHVAGTTTRSCQDFSDLKVGSTLGVSFVHQSVIYQSRSATPLIASDLLPPPNVAELGFSVAGLRADLPQAADFVSVDVAQFNNAPFTVRALDANGGILRQQTVSPPVGTVVSVGSSAAGIRRIEIVSNGPAVTGGGGVTVGGAPTTTTDPTIGPTTGPTGTGLPWGTTVGGSGVVTTVGGGVITVGPGTGVVVGPGGGPGTVNVGSLLVLQQLCMAWTTSGPPAPPGPFLDMWTVACATIGYPPSQPAAPVMDDPISGPWMPATAPVAIREITVPMRGLGMGATVALAREDPGGIVGLNKRSSANRALPLVPTVADDATEPGQGEFTDRQGPPDAVFYRAAQADWFGRWSGWSRRQAAAGVRPKPPRPVLQASYTPPIIASPLPSGPLSGSIEVRVPVPPVDGLAPAANLLASIELRMTPTGQPTTTTTTALPNPSAPAPELVVTLAGQPIARALTQDVTIVGNWIDGAGARSNDSLPVALTLVDPRPPDQPGIPSSLRYASRPDVTGWSRAEVQWMPGTAQQRFRIFVADETTVGGRLSAVASGTGASATRAQGILTAIASAPDLSTRAAVYTANADALTRDMFEQITATPLERPNPLAPLRFSHALSGSLRVLVFYRVIALSIANVEGDFISAPLVPVAVPNTSPPPRPLITATADIDMTRSIPYQVRVQVRVPRGLVPPLDYRLRRSRVSSDPHLMPVVAVQAIPTTAPGSQQFEIVDTGPFSIDAAARLRPWTLYQWVVEVRGGPEPGGGPSADWSTPSAPASLTLVPPDPPGAATAFNAVRSGGGVALTWQHSDPLQGGGTGKYRFDVYRRLEHESEKRIGQLDADAPPSMGGRLGGVAGSFSYTDATAPVAPATATYRVALTDPLGRASPPTAAASV